MKKKTLLFALTLLCLGLSALLLGPALAETSGVWTYELAAEGLVITGYNGAEANVVIPDEIDGYKVSVIGKQAFMKNNTMRTLVIPKGVVSIRAAAFYGCTNLGRIEFNAKNCTVPDIWVYDDNKGAGVFAGAGASSVDGLQVIFGDEVARVPDGLFDTASIDEDGHRGHPCAGVTEVLISDSVKEVGANAFRGCQALERVIFGGGVKQIGDKAFFGCSALPALELNDALVSIGNGAFRGATALETIAWGEGLESIGDNAFRDCTSLETLAFVNPLTTIGARAFRDCSGLKNLYLPDSLVNLRAEAFYGCIKLGDIQIDSVNLSVPGIWVYDDNKGAGVFAGAGSASVNGLTVTFGGAASRVPDGLFDTASIDEDGHRGHPYAFVTEVELSDSVKEVGACAFRNCREIEKVVFGAKLQSLGEKAFWGCGALPALELNDALVSIGDGAFRGAAALESITWGEGLESIGADAFRECTSLEKLAFVNPLTTIGARAFRDCSGLKSLYLPESLVNLKGEAFYGCVNLREIRIDSVNLSVPGIWVYDDNKGAGVFAGAGSASVNGLKVGFGDAVTQVPDCLFDTASIDEDGHRGHPYAFVTEVEIPASVTRVGTHAFRSCQNLAIARFFGSDAEFGDGVFDNCTSADFRVECLPGGSVEMYALEKGIRCEGLSVEPTAQPETVGEPDEEPEGSDTEPVDDDGTWTCSNGHAGNDGNFCTQCGEPRPVDACPNCGYEIPEGADYKFCPKCGSALVTAFE